MEVAQAFQPRLEDYECAICKDLVFKPAVNVCQHVFCFWCLHQSMNNVSESNCPLCRREYGHLARTCGLLHFFLGSAFSAEYKARQAEVLADKERHEIAAEDLYSDPVLLDASPSVSGAPTQSPETSAQAPESEVQAPELPGTSILNLRNPEASILDLRNPETTIQNPRNPSLDGPSTSYSASQPNLEAADDRNGHATEASVVACRPYPFSGPGTKYSFRGVDFGCKLCHRLLHEPTVLVCGHVFCLPCIRTRSADPCCPVCRIMQSDDPRNMVPCAPIVELVSKAFPDEYAARAREVAAEATAMSAEAPQAPPPESPPTVQEAMSRARTLLLSAHADLVRRGEPFNLRAMTDRLLQELDPKYVVHFGVGCDGCGQSPIVGDRFQCADCRERLGFDMCGHCHDMETPVRGLFDQRHTREHRVTKIPPVAAFTTRHYGIDPYRVLFTNPELPYQSVQRMRDEMRDEGELEFFLSELEDAETPGSPESAPSEEAHAGWPGLEYTPSRGNHVDFYPSPAVFPSFFENMSTAVPGARQQTGRLATSPGSPRGSADRGTERLAPGERSPVGGRIWAHRVGGDRGRGPPGGASLRTGAVSGRGGPTGGAPGSDQPGGFRRANLDRSSRSWVEAIMPSEDFDGVSVDWFRGSDGFRARMQEARLHPEGMDGNGNGSGNGSGNGQEAVRGEWHDVHEGGVDGQERPRPATAFGQRQLRRSFGRRDILPYRIPYPEDGPITRGTYVSGERTVDPGPDDASAAATSQEEPSSSVGGDGALGADTEMGVTDANPFMTQPDGSAEEPVVMSPSTLVRPQARRIRVLPSGPVARPVPVAVTVPVTVLRDGENDVDSGGSPWINGRDADINPGGSSWGNGRGGPEPGYSPRARRSMDGLPPLPPRRRSLSASPLERRAGLLMLTLASTAAEHPSFEGASRSSAERNPEVRYRLLERNAPQFRTSDAFPGESHWPLFGEVFAAAAEEPVGQQLLTDFATQFDSERTLQDMQTDDPPVFPAPSVRTAGVANPVGVDVAYNVDDVIFETRGPETAGEASPQDGPEAVNQTAGLVESETGASGATAGGNRVTAGGAGVPAGGSMRQGFSIVESLVRALGGQRRRQRDGQPEAPEASPSQVRRLRRPEE